MTSSLGKTINVRLLAGSASLVTRDQAKNLRASVLADVREFDTVTLDLTEVTAMSPSFADELFGGLRRELSANFQSSIKVRCPQSAWRHLIRAALAYHRRP